MTLEQARQYCAQKCVESKQEGFEGLAGCYAKMCNILHDVESLEAGLEGMKKYAEQKGTLPKVKEIFLAHIQYLRYTAL
jgi:hypothetical protein